MNDEKKDRFQQRMQALHEKYYQQLPEKLQEIHQSWQAWRASPGDATRLDTFYRQIHTLKGTAATFGFTTQSACCLDIQTILMRIKDDPDSWTDQDQQQIENRLAELEKNIQAPATEMDN